MRGTISKLPNTIPLSKDIVWKKWLKSFLSSVRTLQDLCRLTIRAGLRSFNGKCISQVVDKVKLPLRMQNYLLYRSDENF